MAILLSLHRCRDIFEYKDTYVLVSITARVFLTRVTHICVSRTKDTCSDRNLDVFSLCNVLAASFKLQASFAKEPYKTDYILQNQPIILRRLLIVATL